MNIDTIRIESILSHKLSSADDDSYTVCWLKNEERDLMINNTLFKNASNAVFFLNPGFKWQILKKKAAPLSGYVLLLPGDILNHPSFKNLHITEIRIFNSGEIPRINLSPGIEKRIQAILEMMDELISTNLRHREEALLSLLYTFFVYCDGKCNIKSVVTDNNAKSALVYRFKQVVDKHVGRYHEVGQYASILNVSDKYLNECVREVLRVNAKNLINEQLVMRARHGLKFTDKTVKEISFDLGFSSPDYFSYFFKRQTGVTPSEIRKV